MRIRILLFVSVFCAGVCRFCFAETLFTFRGQTDFPQNQFHLVLEFPAEKSITLAGGKTAANDYHLSLDIDHIKTPFCDFLSQIESSVTRVKDEAGPTAWRGKISSRYSLVDYHPIRELAGHFEIKNQRLSLDSLSFGNLTFAGGVDLVYPHTVDLVIRLNSVLMKDFLDFWVKNNNYESDGTVSGEIRVSGPLGHPALKGSLESHNGLIEELAYNSIYLNAQGTYPRIHLARSVISNTDGVSFNLDGLFDLSDLENFGKQLNGLTFSPLVSDSPAQREWTIKRLRQSGSSATEIKYLLKKGGGMGSSQADGSGMLGLERTVEF